MQQRDGEAAVRSGDRLEFDGDSREVGAR